jgi:hypothetical protein
MEDDRPDKVTFFLGLAAASGVAAFLYRLSKNKGVEINRGFEGISIEVRPEQLVDSIKPFVKMNPDYREAIATATKRFISGYNSGEYDD